MLKRMPAKFQDVNPAFFSPPWQSLSRSKWYQMVPAVSYWHPSKQPPNSQGRTTAADEGCGCGAQESCQCVWPPGWEMPSSRHTNGWLEPWVCTVCSHTIDHLYWCITSYIIWLYIWLFQWEHENHPLVLWGSPFATHLPWEYPVAKVLFFGNGSSGDSDFWADSGTGEIRIWSLWIIYIWVLYGIIMG